MLLDALNGNPDVLMIGKMVCRGRSNWYVVLKEGGHYLDCEIDWIKNRYYTLVRDSEK